MKKVFITLCLICMAVLLSSCKEDSSKPGEINQRLNLEAYQGKWIFVNYWASWCVPCHKEIPEINKFDHKHHTKDAVVLGFSYDLAQDARLANLVKKMHIHFLNLREDPAGEFGLSEVTALPVTYVISPQGKLAATLFGPQTQNSLEVAMRVKQG